MHVCAAAMSYDSKLLDGGRGEGMDGGAGPTKLDRFLRQVL